jgi:hypothetical protein
MSNLVVAVHIPTGDERKVDPEILEKFPHLWKKKVVRKKKEEDKNKED